MSEAFIEKTGARLCRCLRATVQHLAENPVQPRLAGGGVVLGIDRLLSRAYQASATPPDFCA
jgi:hypothetical protein